MKTMSVLKEKTDLTEDCLSFPNLPQDHINREFYIRNIMNTFSVDQKVLLVEGPFSSGKTLLLAEFAKYNSDKCCSFFIGNDYWSSNLSRFFIEMCNQMKHLCNSRLKSKLKNTDFDTVQEHELKPLFNRLYTDLVFQARQNKGPFYILIDGLDKIEERAEEESILKYIPSGDPGGVYILLSSSKGKHYSFSHTSISIPYFSQSETEKFFYNFLNKNEIQNVYLACEGMPGYLREIKRQLEGGDSKQIVLENLPLGFNNLLEKSWKELNNVNNDLLEIIGLLSLTNNPFTTSEIGKILNLSKTYIKEQIGGVDFIQENNGRLSILSSYKHFLTEKLVKYKVNINQKLISYYEGLPNSKDSILFLPELYKQSNMYSSVVNLVNIDTLLETLQQTSQTSLVRRNLRVLSDMAYENQDWQRLTWSALVEAVFTRIITNPSALEIEIDSLLSLGKYEAALKLAYDCVLPEDRLLLLAKVCNYMQMEKLYIPEEMIKVLTESIELIDSSLKINDEIIEKIIDISVNLFPLKAELSLRLLKRIAIETGDAKQNNLMDFLLVRLLLRLDPNEETVEQIRNKIGNENLNDFSKAASTLIAENSVEKVIKQVEDISDISAKIYYLQSWCNLNKTNKEAYKIVKYAVKIMMESSEYVPTQLHMRQIAEPLLFCKDIEICKLLVTNFDTLIATVIKNPIEEFAKLGLILASVERKWSFDNSVERFYEIYVLLDEIKELDIKCMVLVQLLTRCEEIVPGDTKLFKDLRNQLIMDFNRLLSTSADHYKITKGIIRELTLIDHNLAYTFASKVNTQQRRNLLSLEILKVYIKNETQEIDFEFIELLLNNIADKNYHDYVLVHIIKYLSKKKNIIKQNKIMKYWKRITNIENLINRTYALSFYLVCNSETSSSMCNQIFKELTISIEKIDSLYEKVNVGLNVVPILAKVNKDLAEDLFQLINNYKLKTSLSDERLKDMFVETCQLLIRIVPDLLKSEDCLDKINNIIKAINCIPSTLDRCTLLSNLGLRCLTAGKEKLFQDIVLICLDLMEKCEDPIANNNILYEISPLIFEYERELLYEKLRNLPIDFRDSLVFQVVKYILSKRPPEDPVDIKSIQRKIDYRDALKVCELLEYVNIDVNVYSLISVLGDLLTERTSNKIKGVLPDKQILKIADKLIAIIDEKLPDKRNIKHSGYKFAALVSINKLRESTSYRTHARWKNILPTEESLRNQVLQLPNISDKTYVLSVMAKKSYLYNPSQAVVYLQDAEKCLSEITNYVDRADRYQIVAEAYNETSNSRAAKYLLEQAMLNAELCSYDQGRDQLIGGVVELAHNIDEHLASTLASRLDQSISNMQVNVSDKLLAITLHSDPQKIDTVKNNQLQKVFNDVLERVLKSMFSGRGVIHHDLVIGKWVRACVGMDYNTLYLCSSWFIENFIAGRGLSNKNTSELNDLYFGILQILGLIQKVDEFLTQSVTTVEGDKSIFHILSESDNLQTYGVGQGEEALNSIKGWISENVNSYIKIYDPYFDESMLEILKFVSRGARVIIMTSAKTKEIFDEELPKRFKNKWISICDQVPPETQIYLYTTPSGRTPLHDRFIISDLGGIQLGTSLNGFGKRDSTIRYLDKEEKASVEASIVNSLIVMPPSIHEGEKLTIKTFTLLLN